MDLSLCCVYEIFIGYIAIREKEFINMMLLYVLGRFSSLEIGIPVEYLSAPARLTG